jgi:hypothetical protein
MKPAELAPSNLLCAHSPNSTKTTNNKRETHSLIPRNTPPEYPNEKLLPKVPYPMHRRCENQGFHCTSSPGVNLRHEGRTFHVSTGRSASLKDQSNFSPASGSSVGSWYGWRYSCSRDSFASIRARGLNTNILSNKSIANVNEPPG